MDTTNSHDFDDYIEAARQESRLAAEPILADLRLSGLALASIDDLLKPGLDYKAQLPLLVEWIPRCDDLAVREVLVRALAVPGARKTNAAPLLLGEFKEARTQGYRWAVALALTGAARPEDAETVVQLFRDPQYGASRQELARVVARLRPPGALQVLVAALDDEDVAGHAVEALGYLGDPQAIAHLMPMTSHPKPWVAKVAAKAIAKLEKRVDASPSG